MKRLYQRTSTPNALALVRYGFRDPFGSTFFEAPPALEDGPALVEVGIREFKQLKQREPSVWFAPLSTLRDAEVKLLEAPPIAALTYEAARAMVYRRCNSYQTMPACICLHPSIPRDAWLRLMGTFWSNSDEVWPFVNDLRGLLGSAGPLLSMMSPEELTDYEALPKTITVYRGGSVRNMNGICWSLNREVAAKFPALSRYRTSSPMLYHAKVRKQDVLAVKLDREEHELITFGAKIFKLEKLPDPPLPHQAS